MAHSIPTKLPELTCGPERESTRRGMTNVERFCAIGWEVDAEGCWIWRGELTRGRRAKIALMTGTVYVARMIWQELHGRIEPASLHVRHKCDQPACVNPDHLELGTAEENAEDMRRRGRRPALSHDQVQRARKLFQGELMTVAEMSRAFNVSENVIHDVVYRRGAYRDTSAPVRKTSAPMWLERQGA